MIEKGVFTAVDANINRSIEGLRVCEDIFRFYIHHPLSSEIKESRHRISAAASALSIEDLIYSRDVNSDEQKFIDTPGEIKRETIADLFKSNIRRAAEALRVLEEFSKMINSPVSAEFQKIRFTVYTIEQKGADLIRKSVLMSYFRNSLYAVLDADIVKPEQIENTAYQLADSGADIIQLLMKNKSDSDFLCYAERISTICREKEKIFIVNTRADIALLSRAHGVHLGMADIPVEKISEIGGSKLLKGVSVNNINDAEKALYGNCDYITAFPLCTASSGSGKQPDAVDLNILKKICLLSDRPVVAAGEFKYADVDVLIDAGCSGIAIFACLDNEDTLTPAIDQFADALKKLR